MDIPESIMALIGNKAPSSIHIVSLSKGSTIQVTTDDSLNVSPVWTPDAKHLLFISDRGGSRDIYFLHLSSLGDAKAQPTRLTTGLDAHTISISRDGQKLTYSVFNYSANLWSIEIPEKGSLSVSKAKQITKGNQIIETVGVSYDGQWLAYSSDLSSISDIYKMPIVGGEAIQLTTHPSGDFSPGWSPDGEKIVFHSFRQGNRDIYCMTKDGGSIQPVTDDSSHEMRANWSPDGSKVVFMSDRTGRYEVYLVSKDNTKWGEAEQMTFDGGHFPQWSPVGNAIAYISENSLKTISYDEKKTKTLVQSQDTLSFPRPKFPAWSPDGKTVYYLAQDEQGNRSIWSVPVEGGEPELKIVSDDPHILLGLVGFDTDEERFYFARRVNESNVWIMDLISRE
jgi:Tol biopolymer transport system component